MTFDSLLFENLDWEQNKCTQNALHIKSCKSNCTPECTKKLRILPINDKTASTDLKSFLSYVSSKKMTFSWFFMISTLEILQKSFKTVQTPNYSYCMSNNIWVIFVKMLHVFHFFIIVPCIFSELKLIAKNLFKNTAWLSNATTEVVTLPSLTES